MVNECYEGGGVHTKDPAVLAQQPRSAALVGHPLRGGWNGDRSRDGGGQGGGGKAGRQDEANVEDWNGNSAETNHILRS